MIAQDKVRKLVPPCMVVHELLHTGQNLVTDGVKIDLRLDQKGGHLVILPRQKLKLPICILRQSGRLKLLPITRGRRTVYSSSAWLIKETVHPLPSHYNKNKHSLRGFISASDTMLILYQTKNNFTHLPSGDRTHSPRLVSQNHTPAVLPLRAKYCSA